MFVKILVLIVLVKITEKANASGPTGSCTEPPQRENIEPVSPARFPVGCFIRLCCADGFVRKAGTSNLLHCIKANNQTLWDNLHNITALVCISAPQKVATTKGACPVIKPGCVPERRDPLVTLTPTLPERTPESTQTVTGQIEATNMKTDNTSRSQTDMVTTQPTTTSKPGMQKPVNADKVTQSSPLGKPWTSTKAGGDPMFASTLNPEKDGSSANISSAAKYGGSTGGILFMALVIGMAALMYRRWHQQRMPLARDESPGEIRMGQIIHDHYIQVPVSSP